jgi:hypothetical protein
LLRDQPLQLRIKFNAADKSPSGTFIGLWQIGLPQKTAFWRSGPMSLAPDTYHEFEVPPNLFDQDGVLTISFANSNDTVLLFPLGSGIEVLYREGGFGLNFARGLGILFCWMSLLTVALSSGTLSTVVSEGTVAGSNPESGVAEHSALDIVAVPFFRGILSVVRLVEDFSPIDSLSSGRSISWGELGVAFSQIVLLLGGSVGLIGMGILSRRELATAQGTQ